jgi:hypothetical protein
MAAKEHKWRKEIADDQRRYFVAQIGNLPYRRLAVGASADCQSAIPQTNSLRYGRCG